MIKYGSGCKSPAWDDVAENDSTSMVKNCLPPEHVVPAPERDVIPDGQLLLERWSSLSGGASAAVLVLPLPPELGG